MNRPSHLAQIALPDDLELRVNHFLHQNTLHIFNRPEFFMLHSNGRGHYCQLVSSKHSRVLAAIHFTDDGQGILTSPLRGTFGGFSAEEGVGIAVLDSFMDGILTYFCSLGAKRIRIALRPASHDIALFATSFNILLRKGFTIERHELNYVLGVDALPLLDKMEHGNRKRVNKCLRERFQADFCPVHQLPEVYQAISENRARRGYPMSITLKGLQEMAQRFPEQVIAFGVRRGADLVAASVCIRLDRDVLYVFLWGEVAGMETYSPVALLATKIYQYSVDQGITLIDVGTSTENGMPNHGLIRFKRSMGFRECLKLTLSTGPHST